MAKNDTRKDLLTTLRGMARSQAAQYVWDYYKIPIFAVILIIAAAISLGRTVFNNLQDEKLLQIGVSDQLAEIVLPYLETAAGGTDQFCLRTYADISTSDGEGALQLSCYVAAQTVDVVLCDEATVTYLIGSVDSPENASLYPLTGSTIGEQLNDEYWLLILPNNRHPEKAASFAENLIGFQN